MWLFAAMLLPACAIQPPQQVEPLPNIIVVLADDFGYGDAGAYNSESHIPTPHIDRLAQEGMRFSDAHSPSSVCTPTRYGLLTGRYAWRTRLKSWVLQGYDPLLIDTTRLTLPGLLQQSGYATAAVGKWHLGLGSADSTDYRAPLAPGPNAVGFDFFFGIPASLDFPPYVFVRDTGLEAPPTEMIAASVQRRAGGEGGVVGFLSSPVMTVWPPVRPKGRRLASGPTCARIPSPRLWYRFGYNLSTKSCSVPRLRTFRLRRRDTRGRCRSTAPAALTEGS